MKIIVVLLICLLALSAEAKKNNRSFFDFKSIINHINSLKTTWTAGHNSRFDNMDIETIKGMMGALEEPAHMKLPVKEIEALEDIPTSFDPRE